MQQSLNDLQSGQAGVFSNVHVEDAFVQSSRSVQAKTCSELPYLRDSTTSTGSLQWQEEAPPRSSLDSFRSVGSSREIVQYATMLGRKWACPQTGHEICYTGKGSHIPLGDDHIMHWVTAMCNEEATVDSPPLGIFTDVPGKDTETYHHQLPALSFTFSPTALPSGLPTPPASLSPLSSRDVESRYLSPNSSSSSHRSALSSDSSPRVSPVPPSIPLLQRTPIRNNESLKRTSLPDPQPQSDAPQRSLQRAVSLPAVPRQASITDAPERSVWSPYSSFFPSPSSSTLNESSIERPGSPLPKSKGKKTKVKVGWLEGTMLIRKGKGYVGKLKKLKKVMQGETEKASGSPVGYGRLMMSEEERQDVIKIVSDAVEMTRSQYSPRVHKMAYEVGKELQAWLQLFPTDELLKSHENLRVLLIFQTCMIPIMLIRLSEIDPQAAILADSLSTALTKVPLTVHDSAEEPMPLFYTPSSSPTPGSGPGERDASLSRLHTHPHPQVYITPTPTSASISSIAIHLVAKELGSEAPSCPNQHSWLGVHLLRILEMTLKVRKSDNDRADDGNSLRAGIGHGHGIGLTRGELDAIWGVGIRRQEQFSNSPPISSLSLPTILPTIRPWEVALLALCASPSTSGSLSPFFTLSVLGPTGLPLLIASLNALLGESLNMDEVKWEDVGMLIRVMAFLSEQVWVVSALGKGKHAILASPLKNSPSSLSLPASINSQNDPKPFTMDNDRELIRALLAVFRRPIPMKWFSIRFWAMDTIRNMVSHRPGRELINLLLEEEAEKAFETLFMPPNIDSKQGNVSSLNLSLPRSRASSPRASTISHTSTARSAISVGGTLFPPVASFSPSPAPGSFIPPASNNPRTGPDVNARTRQRMMQGYRKEAAKRAEELVMYMKIWSNVSDSEMDQDSARERPALWEGKDVGSMRIKVFKGLGTLEGGL